MARLELLSKINNIFVANAQKGNNVDVFILLDNNANEVHQTFWKYDYSDSLFEGFDAEKLVKYAYKKINAKDPDTSDKIKFRARIEEPGQDHFQVVGKVIPVEDKIILNQKRDGANKQAHNDAGVEPASVRFQNNMRWLAGLRDCVKWVQDVEYEQGIFYDLVIRLRDDTLAFGKWILNPEKYVDGLTSARTGSFRGINDHNFVIDRKWADTLFRGFTEDYYFNKTLAHEMWGNPEHRIFQLASANNIPIRNTSICEQPLMPLRGKFNESHWLMHAAYTKKFREECDDPKTRKIDNCLCPKEWYKMFSSGTCSFDYDF